MEYIDLLKETLNNKLSGGYFINVEEEFLYDSIEKILKEDLVKNEDFNFEKIDGELSNPEEIITALERLPLFSEKTYTIIENIDFTKDKVKKYEAILEVLSNYYSNPNPNNVSFIVNTKGSPFKNGKYFKKINKNVKNVDIKRLNRDEFNSFVIKFFIKNNKKLEKKALNYIVNESGYFNKDMDINLYDVENELIKIRDVSDEYIYIEDVDRIKLEKYNDNIFKFLDALIFRNFELAINQYYDLIKAGDNSHHIFSMVIRHFRKLYTVKLLNDKKIYGSKAMQISKLGKFEYEKFSRNKNFTLSQLREIYEYLFDLEKKRKTINPDMNREFEVLIGKICTI
mgnify:CR=1 FL=1